MEVKTKPMEADVGTAIVNATGV
ncbi:hypothetical protein A2U01_0052524, partial [Trifolium medium]|nr:hypothetical protein [Trifolium medium]